MHRGSEDGVFVPVYLRIKNGVSGGAFEVALGAEGVSALTPVRWRDSSDVAPRPATLFLPSRGQ